MKQERRHGMRRRRGDYPLALGLIASALLHMLLIVLNPVMESPSYGRAAGTPSAPGAQFTVLSLSPRDDEDRIQLQAIPESTIPRTTRFGSPGADPDQVNPSGGATGTEPAADASVAERLRHSTMPFSPAVPMRESTNRRAIRETRERVLRAGAELGGLPPTGARSAGSGGGISIPFGFKPPPPAQTVPAPPLPDSILRQDSIRAAARAAAYRDSLRAARDTARLRSVAPRPRVIIPRVIPDTTGW